MLKVVWAPPYSRYICISHMRPSTTFFHILKLNCGWTSIKCFHDNSPSTWQQLNLSWKHLIDEKRKKSCWRTHGTLKKWRKVVEGTRVTVLVCFIQPSHPLLRMGVDALRIQPKLITGMCIQWFLLFWLQMTALETAEEVEAITAIMFLLSLVIKRYT